MLTGRVRDDGMAQARDLLILEGLKSKAAGQENGGVRPTRLAGRAQCSRVVIKHPQGLNNVVARHDEMDLIFFWKSQAPWDINLKPHFCEKYRSGHAHLAAARDQTDDKGSSSMPRPGLKLPSRLPHYRTSTTYLSPPKSCSSALIHYCGCNRVPCLAPR